MGSLGGRLASGRAPPGPLLLDIEVTSSVRLPSGARSGFGVDVLGFPVAGGEAAGSRGLSAAALAADPVDIGARAARVAHTRVVRSQAL